MPRYQGGMKEPTTIFEAAAFQQRLCIVCQRCGHAAVYDPHQLWWLFERRGWVGIFSHAHQRFWCRRCSEQTGRKVKAARIELTSGPVTVPLEFPSEESWRKALARFRG
jgi:ribosomal protein L37E